MKSFLLGLIGVIVFMMLLPLIILMMLPTLVIGSIYLVGEIISEEYLQ